MRRGCERSDFSLTAEDRSAAEAPVSAVSEMIDHSVSSLSAPKKSSFQPNEKTNLVRISALLAFTHTAETRAPAPSVSLVPRLLLTAGRPSARLSLSRPTGRPYDCSRLPAPGRPPINFPSYTFAVITPIHASNALLTASQSDTRRSSRRRGSRLRVSREAHQTAARTRAMCKLAFNCHKQRVGKKEKRVKVGPRRTSVSNMETKSLRSYERQWNMGQSAPVSHLLNRMKWKYLVLILLIDRMELRLIKEMIRKTG